MKSMFISALKSAFKKINWLFFNIFKLFLYINITNNFKKIILIYLKIKITFKK